MREAAVQMPKKKCKLHLILNLEDNNDDDKIITVLESHKDGQRDPMILDQQLHSTEQSLPI